MVQFMKRTTAWEMAEIATRWRLTDDHLIEEGADGLRLWGRWDRQFGLWDERGLSSVPDMPLLGRLGTWFEPDGSRDDDWYGSRAALAAYWSLVPTTVRLIASRLPVGQWSALIEMWRALRTCTA